MAPEGTAKRGAGGPKPPRPASGAESLDPALYEHVRPHLGRQLFRLAPGRPAFGAGLRLAIVLSVPVAVGSAIGQLDKALVISLGGLNVLLADPGGAPSTRCKTLSVTTVLVSVAIALGTIAGLRLWTAVLLMFVVAVASGLANLYGHVAATVGLLVSILFIVGFAFPGDASAAAEHLGLCLVGGAWAMLVALVLWPSHPFDAPRAQVAACYRALGRLVGDLASVGARQGSADRLDLVDNARLARGEIESAVAVLAAIRAGRAGDSAASSDLLQLLGLASRVVSQVEGLVEPVGVASQVAGLADSWPSAVGALRAAGASLSGLADRMSGTGAAADPASLDQLVEKVDAQARELRVDDLDAAVALRLVARGTAELAALVGMAGRYVTGSSMASPGPPPADGPPVRSAVRPLRSDLHVWMGTLRANLTTKSVALRHGIRFGVTAAVGTAIGLGFRLERGYWVPLTIAVVLQPYASATLQRALMRVLGTVVGASIGALLLSAVHSEAGLIILLALLAFVFMSLIPLNYGLAVVFITPMVVVLLALPHPGDLSIAVSRVVDTLIGGALALAGGFLLWPRAERDALVSGLATAVRAERGHLDAVLESCERRPDTHERAEVARMHEAAGTAVGNAQVGFQRLLGESWRGPSRVGSLWSTLDASRRLFHYTSAIESHAQSMGRMHARPALADLRTALIRRLDGVERRLEGDAPTVQPTGGDREATVMALEQVKRQMAGHRRRRRSEVAAGELGETEARRLVLEDAPFGELLDPMADAVSELERSTDALASGGPDR